MAYVYRKSWKTDASSGKNVEYQLKNYEQVRIEDPGDTNFLPGQLVDKPVLFRENQRVRLGVWVLLFLAVFTLIAWRLNAAYWKDVK